MNIPWTKSKDKNPSTDSPHESTPCLVIFHGHYKVLSYDHIHQVWRDDNSYFCQPEEPSHWVELPKDLTPL